MLRTLVRNITSSWVAFAVEVVLRFFLTPFILHTLGNARYGFWALLVGLIGYCGLLDLGFRAGLTQYMARYLAAKDYAKLNESASTAFIALLCCGVVVGILTFIFAWLMPLLFGTSEDLALEMRYCILIMGVSLAIQFSYYPFAAVFAATQRYELSYAVHIAFRVSAGIATFIMLKNGYGLIGLSLVRVVSEQAMYLTLIVISRSVLPELVISPLRAARQSLLPLVKFSSWSFLVSTASQIKLRADNVIIGLFLPLAAITPYSLAQSMIEHFENLFVPIGHIFFPLMTQLDAKGDRITTKKVYLSGTKLLLLLASTLGIFTAAWAGNFFQLWIGPGATSGGIYPSPASLYLILVSAAIMSSAQRIGCQALAGARKIRQLGCLTGCEVTLKLILSVALLTKMGLVGVAIGTFLPAIIFQTIVVPFVTCRFLDISARTYIRKAILRPVMVVLCEIGILVPAMCYLEITSWLQLFLYSSLTFIALMPAIFFIGLDGEERQRFFITPAVRLGCWISWLPVPPDLR